MKNHKVVLITGASSGFGLETAEYLSGLGYKVYGASRSCTPKDIGFEMIPLDVSSGNSVDRCVERVLNNEEKIDVLINNAGYILSGFLEETELEEARSVLDTNFFGTVRMTKRVLPVMRSQGGGRIINIGSSAGLLAVPNLGFYSASKYALEGYTETLRYEVESFKIKVSIIEPAIFKTNIGRSKAMAKKRLREYNKLRRSVKRALKNGYDTGGDPYTMALLIEKIIKKENPRLRYSIGPNSRLVDLLTKYLPESVTSWALKRHYNLK